MAIRLLVDQKLREKKEQDEQRLQALIGGDGGPNIQQKSLGLSLKKPGIGAMLGDENPLKDEENSLLAKYFRLKRTPLSQG